MKQAYIIDQARERFDQRERSGAEWFWESGLPRFFNEEASAANEPLSRNRTYTGMARRTQNDDYRKIKRAEDLEEVVKDKRKDKRASKQKAKQRNRRYEKRLLRHYKDLGDSAD